MSMPRIVRELMPIIILRSDETAVHTLIDCEQRAGMAEYTDDVVSVAFVASFALRDVGGYGRVVQEFG